MEKNNSGSLHPKWALCFILKWHHSHNSCHIGIFDLDNNDDNDAILFANDLYISMQIYFHFLSIFPTKNLSERFIMDD